MTKPILFSGIQPTGNIHLGNFLGALKNWVRLQNEGRYQCIYSIVDYHAMTVKFDPGKIAERIKETAIVLLAVGLDPQKSIIFVQSTVPEHTELAWIFNCLIPIAELERMHQFKEKSEQNKSDINAGLFTYPVLMAADILLYKSLFVPVGEDQKQHVELTRVIAKKFNNKFSAVFPEPETLLTNVPRVMSLAEPLKKMSKSLGDKHYIALTDSAEIVKKKIMSAVTDTGAGAKISPGVANLFSLLEETAGDPNIALELKTAQIRGQLKYIDLKQAVFEAVWQTILPIQKKIEEIKNQPSILAEVLISGTVKAQKIAQETMKEVKEKCGILPPKTAPISKLV